MSSAASSPHNDRAYERGTKSRNQGRWKEPQRDAGWPRRRTTAEPDVGGTESPHFPLDVLHAGDSAWSLSSSYGDWESASQRTYSGTDTGCVCDHKRVSKTDKYELPDVLQNLASDWCTLHSAIAIARPLCERHLGLAAFAIPGSTCMC